MMTDALREGEKRIRVLVVDDEHAALQSIECVLSTEAEVVCCTSAERALELLAAERFQVICSDFKMPGMNGAELLRRASQLPYFIGCLLVTGADEYLRTAEGNRPYVILKPFDPEKLIGLVLQLAALADMKHSVRTLTDSMGPKSR